VVQAAINAVLRGKESLDFYLILSPVVKLPIELEKLFTVVEHPLPTREQLQTIADAIEVEDDKKYQPGAIDAAIGLTTREAENAFSLSFLRHNGELRKEEVWDAKTQAVKKSGFLELYQGEEAFGKLGGMTGLKNYCQLIMRPERPFNPKGVLLLGPSGTGKSAFAKALGNATGRPVLMMDIGRLHSKYVGDSEANLRSALRLADALAPDILFIDEVEKALGGVDSDNDGGVSQRIFGSLLTYQNDHTTDVMILATANNIQRLPPEFSRPGRFDRIFFIDLPREAEREEIWAIYRREYDISDLNLPPHDDNWTGAEIRECCRSARQMGVSLVEASKGIIPVAVSSADKITALRNWAKGKVLDANTGEIYDPTKGYAVAKGSRKVLKKEAV
jgi:hypothetical protein